MASRVNKQQELAPAPNKPVRGPAQPPKPKENYLTPEEINDLRETFDLFDDDKSGTIDPHEIKKVLEDLGVDARNKFVYQMVQDLENFGGAINFDTFVDIISNRLGNNKTREGAFKLF
jgi:Ca2+-binding EF-hand superfamily protein